MDGIQVIANVLDEARAAEESGRWDDALALYHAALDEWQDRGGAPVCELLRKIGCVHFYRGDLGVALNLFESSRRLAEESGRDGDLAEALNCLGAVSQSLGQLDQAAELYAAAQRLAEQTGKTRLAVMIDQNLGIIANIRGDTAEALERYQSALERYRGLGEALKAARVLNNIGMVLVDMECWAEAEIAFDTALRETEALGDRESVATVQLNRAELYLSLERFDDARMCCDQAFEIFGRIGSKSGLGETYKMYGVLYRESGKMHLAEAHLAQVAELAQASDHPLLEAEAEAEIAIVHLTEGRSKDALHSLNRAHRLFGDLKARRELVHVEKKLDKLERTYLQIVQFWGESIESVDGYTAGHCTRVADYTCRLAEAVGYTGRELTWVRMGAFLHDVGKTSVDAAVLNKPGALDPREWEEMRRHTIAGDEIVAELGFPYDIRPMVRSHHERWDGTGYPDRLAGEQIPRIARILCIVDVFDALTTDRSYRKAYSRHEALEIMASMSGVNFEPTLFETFREMVARELVATLPQE